MALPDIAVVSHFAKQQVMVTHACIYCKPTCHLEARQQPAIWMLYISQGFYDASNHRCTNTAGQRQRHLRNKNVCICRFDVLNSHMEPALTQSLLLTIGSACAATVPLPVNGMQMCIGYVLKHSGETVIPPEQTCITWQSV